MGAIAKSYMRKGFLIFEEMRKYLVIYEEAVSLRKILFSFFSVQKRQENIRLHCTD
jgi:hypothetical protein